MSTDGMISALAITACLVAIAACLVAHILAATAQEMPVEVFGQGRVFRGVEEDAISLLRAVKEHHDRHQPEAHPPEVTRVASELVAGSVGLEPGTLRYERAVEYLVREGALVWEERSGGLSGVDLYRITSRGLEMLGAT